MVSRPLINSRLQVVFFAALLLSVLGAVNSNSTANPNRAVLGSNRKPPVVSSVRYNFEVHNSWNTHPIEHTFILRSVSKDPVTVDRLQPLCACTTVFVESPRNIHPPFILKPDRQVNLHVSIDPTRVHPGSVLKSIFVFVHGESKPAATLEMAGTILPAVSFSPHVLNFGRVTTDGSKSLVVAVSLNPALLSSGRRPRLVCSNPDITITPQSKIPYSSRLRSLTTPAQVSDQAFVRQTYKLTLSTRPRLGLIDGALFVTSTNKDIVEFTNETLGSIPVLGEIVGNIAASPKVIVLGPLRAGKSVRQSILLTSSKPENVQILNVLCPNRFISPRLVTAESEGLTPPALTNNLLLEVSVSSNSPLGVLETEVVIRTSTEEQIRLPLIVSIIAPASSRQVSKRG